jgi:hypothetical protein
MRRIRCEWQDPTSSVDARTFPRYASWKLAWTRIGEMTSSLSTTLSLKETSERGVQQACLYGVHFHYLGFGLS